VKTRTGIFNYISKKYNVVSLYLAVLFLILTFIFIPHYIELSDVVESWFFAKGLLFYKDFVAYHFPLGKLILLPIHYLTALDLRADPFLGLAIGILTTVFLYKIGILVKNKISIPLSLFFFSIYYWLTATGVQYYHEQLIALLLTITIYCYLRIKLHKHLGIKNLFIIGLLISLTELAGQVVSLTLIVFFILVVYSLFVEKKSLQTFILNILSFLAGCLVPFLLLALYFFLKGGLEDFIFSNITYYFIQYSDYGNRPILQLPLYLLAFYLPIFGGLLLFINKKFRNNPDRHIFLFLFFLSLSTLPFVLFSVFHPHHITYALPILSMFAGIVFIDLRKYSPSMKLITKLLSLLLVSIFILGFVKDVIPWYKNKIKYPATLDVANDLFPGGDGMYNTVEWIKNNTPPAAKILVIGDSLFYLKSNRMPAIKTCKGMEYVWRDLNSIKKEIYATPPAYWIIGMPYLEKLEKVYRQKEVVVFVNRYLKNNYKLVHETGVWQIWKKSTD